MEFIHFDWETFSPPKLGDVSSYAYSVHPDADIVSAAWAFGSEDPEYWSPLSMAKYIPQLELLWDKLKNGAKLLAWNVTFEFDIWNNVAVPKYHWPELRKEQILDVQAIALSMALPDALGECAKILGMQQQKDKEGDRLIKKLCRPRKPSKLNPYSRWRYLDARQDYERFFKYNIQDVVVEREIFKRLQKFMLSKFEQKMWEITFDSHCQGVPFDIETIKDIMFILSEYDERLKKEVVELTNGTVKTTNQIGKVLEFLWSEGADHIRDLTKDTVKAELDDPYDLSEKAYRILEIRQLLAKSSVSKFEKILAMADEKGRVHNTMRYHNSTTGRWGGAGVQIHNLPRGDVKDPKDVISVVRKRDLDYALERYPNIKTACSSIVRSMIEADPVHRFLVADFSAIEAITISWMFNEYQALKKVWEGNDIYRWYATLLYPGTPYEKITKHQRGHAKVCLLGLGYQMGIPTFIESSAKYGINFSQEEGEYMVNLYRRTFPNVKKSWYDLERLAIKTVRTGQKMRYGKLEFSLEDDFLRMLLPSGRKVSYPQPIFEDVETPWGAIKKGLTCWQRKPQSKKWIRKTITPGRIVENAIQATARDILAEAKLRLINNGYNVLFSVHDEIICHNHMLFGSLDEMISIMCDTDQRKYKGLPMSATGFVTNRYKKD